MQGFRSGGDAQYLFATDILGANRDHVPRHAKVYRNLAVELHRLQQERIAAFTEFKADVDDGTYPAREHSLEIADAEFDGVLAGVG